MTISVFYDHVQKACENLECSMPVMLQNLRSWGIDAVYPHMRILSADDRILEEIKNAGLTVSGLCGSARWASGFASKEDAKALVDMAQRCGTDNILIVPGFLPEEEAAELRNSVTATAISEFMASHESIRNIQAGLQYTVDYAATKGITVSLEDFDGLYAPYARLTQLQWWMENVPGLRFTLDTGNFAFSDEDSLTACHVLRDKIVHVHCKDRGVDTSIVPGKFSRGLRPCAVGDGYLPMEQIISYLRATGYTGALTIEHYGVKNFAEAIRRSAAYLNSI